MYATLKTTSGQSGEFEHGTSEFQVQHPCGLHAQMQETLTRRTQTHEAKDTRTTQLHLRCANSDVFFSCIYAHDDN